MAENITGELKRCSDFVVTYYWTLPAIGLQLYTNITLITVSVSSALLGSIANVLVVLSYFKNSRLRTLSNIPLLSLAFSDLLVTAVVLPLHSTRLIKEIYGTHDCILWTFTRLTSYFSAGVSLLTVTFISVERFITLAYPYRYQTILTRLRMKIIVATIWCFTFAFVVSHLGLIPYKVFLALSATIVVICIITLLSIWTWVLKLLRRHKRRITTQHRPSQTSKNEIKSRQQSAQKHANKCCACCRSYTVLSTSRVYVSVLLHRAYEFHGCLPRNIMGRDASACSFLLQSSLRFLEEKRVQTNG